MTWDELPQEATRKLDVSVRKTARLRQRKKQTSKLKLKIKLLHCKQSRV